MAAEPGVRRVGPLIVVPQAAQAGTTVTSVNLIGTLPHGLGSPTPVSGRPVVTSGQAVVDSSLGLGIGRHFAVAGHTFTVVGLVSDRTLDGGVANAYVTLGAAQDIVFGGRNLISGVLTTGVPKALPAGLALKTSDQIEQASIAQLATAVLHRQLAGVHVVDRRRHRGRPHLRDRPGTNSRLRRLESAGVDVTAPLRRVAAQAIVVALAAAAVGAVISTFMGGLFAQPVDIPGSAYVILPLSALVVGLVASLAALRRAVSVDPAVAFAG